MICGGRESAGVDKAWILARGGNLDLEDGDGFDRSRIIKLDSDCRKEVDTDAQK
jgi:hypothetical protein